VREGLEFVVDSQRVGFEKPDPRSLKLALDRMGIAADRALYVGDMRSVDEAVARAAGSHFVLVDPYGDYGPGIDSVASMFDLPAHVAGRFTLPLEQARPDRTGRA
jgi:putative hydrolase of the HAD superfamily